MPQAGTRAPGELWLNFADANFGYIDASQTAQKLLAVRLFVTTTSYAIGDFVVYAGALYQAIAPSAAGAFTAANWSRVGTMQDLSQYLNLAGGTLTGALNLPAAAPTVATQAANKSYVDTKLPLAGGTMTGPIVLVADPTAPLQPATKQYVDNLPSGAMNDNRIINGDMRIDQRGVASGAGGTAIGYTVDRWGYNSTLAGKAGWQRVAGGPSGFPYSLYAASQSAYVPVAADGFQLYQIIEADAVSDFAWGAANAQPVTLSFWVNSSLSGTFSGCISNAAGTRSYPFAYSIPTANVWTKIIVTIPGDTTGTWVMSGNAGSVVVHFDLGAGANYRGPANAWASANYIGVTGAVSLVATNAATFYLTGVKLEVGSIATPFNRQSLAKSLADCQRYYVGNGVNITVLNANGFANGAGYSTFVNWVAPVTMRAMPTVVAAWSSLVSASGGPISATADARTIYSYVQSTATGGYAGALTITSLSAEL